jgi:hypothetical protein
VKDITHIVILFAADLGKAEIVNTAQLLPGDRLPLRPAHFDSTNPSDKSIIQLIRSLQLFNPLEQQPHADHCAIAASPRQATPDTDQWGIEKGRARHLARQIADYFAELDAQDDTE